MSLQQVCFYGLVTTMKLKCMLLSLFLPASEFRDYDESEECFEEFKDILALSNLQTYFV